MVVVVVLFTAPKVARQCPLVLLVNVGWKQGQALESEEGSVLGNGLLEEVS
jgi:hypothetical protein